VTVAREADDAPSHRASAGDHLTQQPGSPDPLGTRPSPRSARGAELWVVLIVVISRLPFVFNGFGLDIDGWIMVTSGKVIAATGHYTASRLPGNPVVEFAYALLPWRDPVPANGLTVVATALCAVLVLWLARDLRCERPLLIAIAFAMTPVVYVASVTPMDYLAALTAALASLFLMFRRRPLASGLLLGVAAGARVTSLIFFIGLIAIILSDRETRRSRGLVRLLLGLVPALLVVRLPVTLEYGRDAFTVAWDPQTSFRLMAANATDHTWGLIGVVGLAATATMVVLGIGRDQVPRLSSRQRGFVIAAVAVIVVELVAFVRLPLEAGYLIPVVPLTLLLVGRLTGRAATTVLCASLIAAPFIVGLHDQGSPSSSHAIASVPGHRHSQITWEGPILLDRLQRVEQTRRTEQLARFAEGMSPRDALIVGRYETFIRELFDLPPDLADRVVLGMTTDEVRAVQRAGGTVFYVEEEADLVSRTFGIDPAALDLKAVPPVP